jgi:hypothetical protein
MPMEVFNTYICVRIGYIEVFPLKPPTLYYSNPKQFRSGQRNKWQSLKGGEERPSLRT